MDSDIDKTKKCNTCGIEKLVSDFSRDRHKHDGLCTVCKSCKRSYRISPEYKLRESELEKTKPYKDRMKKYYSSKLGRQYLARDAHRHRSDILAKEHSLTLKEWEYILDMQDHRCAICGCSNTLERDCIIPISMGGVLCFDNTQAVCKHCNSVKGTKAYSGILGNRWRSKLLQPQ
jgi:hypothetical protein